MKTFFGQTIPREGNRKTSTHLQEAANETGAPLEQRIRKKVRDHAALIGQTRPAPLILIDALPGKGA